MQHISHVELQIGILVQDKNFEVEESIEQVELLLGLQIELVQVVELFVELVRLLVHGGAAALPGRVEPRQIIIAQIQVLDQIDIVAQHGIFVEHMLQHGVVQLIRAQIETEQNKVLAHFLNFGYDLIAVQAIFGVVLEIDVIELERRLAATTTTTTTTGVKEPREEAIAARALVNAPAYEYVSTFEDGCGRC